MFILYDENMQEIQYPEGLLPLDIFVSSLQKTVETETVPGVPGHILYGTTHQQRTVELTMWLKSKDSTDYRLLRNEIYALFDTGRYMYVAEKNVPSRVLKILIDNAYTPSRLTSTVAEVTISARTLDEVYWQSRYTTLELHDSGYSAIAEKYGLVDNIDDEKVKYRFTPDLVHTELTSDLFEQGSMFLSNGQNADGNTQPGRLKNHYSVIKGQNYRLNLSETGGTVNYIRVFHYDDSGNHISNERSSDVWGNGDTSLSFVALGTSIRLLIYANGDTQVNVGGIGTLTKISLSSFRSKSEFNVYNAGNVQVTNPQIEITGVTGSNFAITNVTTGETVQINRTLDNRTIGIGLLITDNGLNIFRDTNRKSISLAPGDNLFEVSGASYDEVRFDFKYYYK